MQTIWKYELETTDTQEVNIPLGAKILDVQVQHGKPCLWALVDTDRRLRKTIISTYGTGHNVDRTIAKIYIGTYQLSNGDFVFHVFVD